MTPLNPRSPRSKPWYREPWPWMLMTGPFVVVVAGLATAWIAVKTEDGLVEDDYYKKGLAINRTLARDQAARALHLKAQLMLSEDGSRVRLMLQGMEGNPLPQRLRLKLLHPTRSGMDQVVGLSRQAGGYYEGKVASLEPARWRLVLEDEGGRWRLSGSWYVPGARSASLGGAR